MGKEHIRSRVEIDADRIHAVFDHAVERFVELRLLHVMLILPHADRLRVDLHKLGKRILQAACDRHGGTLRDVEIGEFLGSRLRCRVNRRARLADHYVFRSAVKLAEKRGDKVFAFAGCRSVADRNDINAVLLYQCGNGAFRAGDILPRLRRIYHRRIEHTPRLIDDRKFASGAVSGVVSENAFALERRAEKKVAQIIGKHADRADTGAVEKIGAYLPLDRRGDQARIRIRDRARHIGESRAAAVCDRAVEKRVQYYVLTDLDGDLKRALVLSAVHGEIAVRRKR